MTRILRAAFAALLCCSCTSAPPCTVTSDGASRATIRCPDGSSSTIDADRGGREGAGLTSSCSVTDHHDGTYTLTCGATSITLHDGSGCTIRDFFNGLAEITCGDGTHAMVGKLAMEPRQTITGANAQDVEPFEMDGERYLAVARIYDGNAVSPVSPYDVDSEIWRWDGTQFVLAERIDTRGAHDVAAFTIGEDHFLAVAQYYATSSRIFRWSRAAGHFVAFQDVPTTYATGAAHLVIGGDDYVLLTMQYSNTTGYTTDSPLLKWTGVSFEQVQTIRADSPIDADAFAIGTDHFLAVSSYYSAVGGWNGSSPIFKWDGTRFVDFQSVPTHASREVRHLKIDGKHYLLAANQWSPYEGYAVRSELLEWNGTEFVSRQFLDTFAAYGVASFCLGSATYLAVAQVTPAPYLPDQSRIYQWTGDGFDREAALPTMSAGDVDAFTIGEATAVVFTGLYASGNVTQTRVYR